MKKIVKLFGFVSLVSSCLLIPQSEVQATEGSADLNGVDTQSMEDDPIQRGFTPAYVQLLSPEAKAILEEAKIAAAEQQQQQTYEEPPSKVTYKLLFVALDQVTIQDPLSGEPKSIKLSEEEKKQAILIAEELSEQLNKIVPNVTFEVDFKLLEQNIVTDAADKVVAANNVPDFVRYIENNYDYGSYDGIITTNGDTGNGSGVTAVKYNAVNGASYMRVGLSFRKTYSPNYSTIIALHELCHAMSNMPVNVNKGNVHGASSYGYVSDPITEWYSFYRDYLTGKIKETSSEDSNYLGIFPKMWQVTPRFTLSPAKIKLNYVDENGRKIAESENFFGPGGDTYELKTRSFERYTFKEVQGDSIEGALETGKAKEITFVYEKDPEFNGAVWVYKPNNQPDQAINDMNVLTFSTGYRNKYGSTCFDIKFQEKGENVGEITSSNPSVVEFQNYEDGVARFSIKNVGTAELSFTSKDGSYTYKKKVEIQAPFDKAVWAYKPNNQPDQTINDMNTLTFSTGYRNKYGSPWFDIKFQEKGENVGKITSSNPSVVEFRNYEDGVARFNIKNPGVTELSFTSKDGSYTYKKKVEIQAPFDKAVWAYKPNNQPDQTINDMNTLTFSTSYRNRYGSPWFDIKFQEKGENVGKITSSNPSVVEFRNYEDGVARFNIKNPGVTELSFTSKDGSYTYKKKVEIQAPFDKAVWAYKPNNQPDQTINDMNTLTFSTGYRNKYGSPWFDIKFQEKGENVGKITSSNPSVVEFRNYEDGVARFNIKNPGVTELSFTSKDGSYTYKKKVEIQAPFDKAVWAYKPNNQPDQTINDMNTLTFSTSYRNRYGSPWFDIKFQEKGENVGKITSSNPSVVEFRNYEDGVARFNIKNPGTTELSFISKDGSYTFKKKVVIK